MWMPRGFKPPTPAEWQVIGCLVWLFCLGFVGLALYACFRTGFKNPTGVCGLIVGILLVVGLGLTYRYVNK